MPLRATPLTVAAAAVGLALGLAGCGSWQKTVEGLRAEAGDSRPYATLEGTRWQLRAALLEDGPAAPDEPVRYTLAFGHHHRAVIQAGCNEGLGAWTASGVALRMDPVRWTRLSCGDDLLAPRLQQAVARVRAWYLRDGDLVLELAERGLSLRFAPLAAATDSSRSP